MKSEDSQGLKKSPRSWRTEGLYDSHQIRRLSRWPGIDESPLVSWLGGGASSSLLVCKLMITGRCRAPKRH